MAEATFIILLKVTIAFGGELGRLGELRSDLDLLNVYIIIIFICVSLVHNF